MSSVAEQIKARLGVQDVIGTYLKLENAGANMKAKCPFHAEKTPSFFVSPARGSYYCFGCNRGGDIFTFVQEIEGIEFRQALRILAERAGVPITFERDENDDRNKVLREIMEVATLFYQKELSEDNEPMNYLLGRGLNKKTISEFRIGYAPDSWKKCVDYLLVKNYKASDIEAVGLSVSSKSGSTYDRFRQRVMFPIFDSMGHVIAFTGRIFEAAHESQTVKDMSAQGKYVNSPQTSLYNKSSVLYAYDKAKVAIRKENVCILVEGQMDAIMSHQAGLINTVAVSGTALTKDHLLLIKRLTNNLTLAFDADSAGVASSRRAIEMALELEMDTKVAVVTGGKDPADSIKENPDAWRTSVKNSVHVVEYYLRVITSNIQDKREVRKRVEKEVVPFVARIKSPIDQAHFVSLVADKIGLKEDIIWGSIKETGLTPVRRQEDEIKAKSFVPPVVKSREDVIVQKIFGILFWQESEPAQAVMDTSTIRRTIAQVLEGKMEEWENALAPQREKLMFEAEAQYAGSEEVSNEIDRLLASLESELLKKRFQDLMGKLKAESDDTTQTKQILEECQKIGSKLEALKRKENKVL